MNDDWQDMGWTNVFSTESVDIPLRMSRWVEGSTLIGGIEAEQVSSRPFHGVAKVRSIGDTIAFKTVTGPHRFAWTKRLIERAREPHLRVWFQQHGRVRLETGGGVLNLKPGDWLLLDSRQPYALDIEESCEVVALQFPLDRLHGFAAAAPTLSSRIFPTEGGVAQMVRQCLDVALDSLPEVHSGIDGDLGDSLLGLAQIALREKLVGTRTTDTRGIGRERIRAYVRRHIDDPGLSVATIAKAMGCSPRYVHKTFNGDETIGDYVRKQRLERCRTQLASSRDEGRSITQIAYENGFNSSSHFSRAFKQHFGVSPREYRASSTGQFASC